MLFQSPASTLFNVYGYDVKLYGVAIFCALIAGIFVSIKIAKKYYKCVDTSLLLDFYPIMIISAIICARMYYVLLNLNFYVKNTKEIFALWHGGISIHGAILGGLIAGIIYFKKNKMKILPYADVVSYGLVLGQAIGRWGNFFNSEAYGLPTDLPWKLYIAPQFRPLEYYDYSFFHPTFLYESIWDVIVFIILFCVIRKFQKQRYGLIFFSYFVLYSIGRFFIEGLRIDSVLNVGAVPIAQIVSILTFFAGVIGIIYCIKKAPQ